jgi:pseudouridine kinase
MRLTAREAEILDLLRREPLLAPAEIARRLKTSRAAVAVHLSTLARKGEILGRGYMLRGTTYVAVVGGSNIDIKTRIDGDTVLATSNPGRATVSAGGVGRNIAHNLGRLGTAAKLISVVGDDAEGTRLVRDTAKAGVDVGGVLRGRGASGLYSAVLDRNGELVIGVAAMEVLEQLTVKELDDRRAILENAAMIVADCNLNPDGLAFVARLAEVPAAAGRAGLGGEGGEAGGAAAQRRVAHRDHPQPETA